ncbi:hypothetical protein MRX96_005115 [Rhipicephalus microplus]
MRLKPLRADSAKAAALSVRHGRGESPRLRNEAKHKKVVELVSPKAGVRVNRERVARRMPWPCVEDTGCAWRHRHTWLDQARRRWLSRCLPWEWRTSNGACAATR